MADDKLQILITADNEDAVKKIKDVTKSLDGVTVSSTKVSQGQKNMATEVLKGVASWDALKKAMNITFDFMKESIQASIDADAKMEQVRNTLVSIGPAAEAAMPQIENYSRSMAKLGMDDEDTAVAVAKLAKLLNGDTNQAMKLVTLSANLATSGVKDFQSNVDTMANIVSGHGNRVMKEYNLTLDQNATNQQIIDSLTKKVTTTIEQHANTVQGKTQIMKQGFSDLKEAVGTGLTNAFLTWEINAVNASNDVEDHLNDISDTVAKTAIVLQGVFGQLTDWLRATGAGFKGLVYDNEGAQKDLVKIWDDYNKHLQEAFNPSTLLAHTKALKESSQYEDEANKLMGTGNSLLIQKARLLKDNASSVTAGMDGQVKINQTLIDSLNQQIAKDKDAQKALAGLSQTTGELGANSDAAGSASNDLKDALTKLKDTYGDLKNKGSEALAALADEQSDKMQSIRDDIAKTEKSITELTAIYQKQIADLEEQHSNDVTDNQKDIAEKIVAAQQKIADDQKSLQTETDNDRRNALLKEINDTQATLQQNATLLTQLSSQIAAAQKTASESELQQEIDVYNEKMQNMQNEYVKKRRQAETEYQDKLNDLKKQLEAENQNVISTLALYEQKETMINDMESQALTLYQGIMENHKKATLDAVNAEIGALQTLASLISTTKSASGQTQLGNVQLQLSGARAAGGPVGAGSAYLVGENGPEVFIPGQSGGIIPNGKISNGSNHYHYNITITGNQFLNKKQLARELGDELVRQLKMNVKL